MHYIFNQSWIVEVLLALPGVVLVVVAVLLGVRGEVMVHKWLMVDREMVRDFA